MFSKRYYRYAIVAVILIGWLTLIDYRNRNNPRVGNVAVEADGQNYLVSCELWNPSDEEVQVMAILRLVETGSPEVGVREHASAASVVKRKIGPHQRIFIKEPIKCVGTWNNVDVQVFVISNFAESGQVAAR
jgi:hypothetical protein